MKINGITPQYYVNTLGAVKTKEAETPKKVDFTQNKNVSSPFKQDALTHMAYLGIQNLKYTSNVTFRGNNNKKIKVMFKFTLETEKVKQQQQWVYL